MTEQEHLDVSERILEAVITQVDAQVQRGEVSRTAAIEFYETSAARLNLIAKSHRTLSAQDGQ